MKFLWFIFSWGKKQKHKPVSTLDEIIHDDWYKAKILHDERMQKLRSKDHLGKDDNGKKSATGCRA